MWLECGCSPRACSGSDSIGWAIVVRELGLRRMTAAERANRAQEFDTAVVAQQV
jgi:hypothetical protein